jgi:hypothetical protein
MGLAGIAVLAGDAVEDACLLAAFFAAAFLLPGLSADFFFFGPAALPEAFRFLGPL